MAVGFLPAIIFLGAVGLSIYAYTGDGNEQLITYSYPTLIAGFVVAAVLAFQTVSQGGLNGLIGIGSLLGNFVIGAIASGVVLVVHRVGRRA